MSNFNTLAIHGGLEPDPQTGAILTPIHQTTTYAQPAVGVDRGYTYSRVSNPTVDALERALGAIENAPPAVTFKTGMAAITTLFLSMLKSGDHVVVSEVVYGGTVRLLGELLSDLGIEASFPDTSDLDAVRNAIRDNTRLVFLESPGNPTLKLTDIAAVSALAHDAGIPVAVDNTFMTQYLVQPLELGADVALYSTTKHIEGHNSTLGGSITTRNEALLERIRRVRKTIGCIQSPQDAWLTLRGLKTLPVRLRAHSEAAAEIAAWLEAHPAVAQVNYPGLSSFAQPDLAARQHPKGHGGLLSFEVKGGVPAAHEVLKSVALCTLAENLGAVETLITHPATMTHADVPPEQRRAAGIHDGLMRLSVGLEDVADIIADLDQALVNAGET